MDTSSGIPAGHASRQSSRTANDSTYDLESADIEHTLGTEKSTCKAVGYIEWDGPDDPEHPQNWNFWKKVHVTIALAFTNNLVAIATSIFGSGSSYIAKEFHVSHEATVLGTSLFLVGYTVGPLFWGPLSEKIGRKPPLLIGVAVFGIFSIMVAVGKNYATLMVGRFISGCFGVSPVAVLGAVTDNWSATDRGVALAATLGMGFTGPTLGPLIGNFISESYLGWRWTMWLMAILGLASSLIYLFTLPETYPPRVLMKKSARLRKETGDSSIKCSFDDESISFGHIARVYLIRPWRLFFTEPILVLVTIYHSFIYGMVFLFFQVFPIAFQEERGWKLGKSGLPYLGIIIGVICGCITVIVYTRTKLAAQIRANNGEVKPEMRLPLMIFGGCLLPIGLFWFAWTSDPNIPWPSMTAAGIPIGWGMYTIFIQCFIYLIDVYTDVANSALAANGVVRSLVGAGFPLFATSMYHRLGVQWATSLLAFIGILLVPVPIVFFIYGEKIRAMSGYAKKER